MDRVIITLVVRTDADLSEILTLAQEAQARIAVEVNGVEDEGDTEVTSV